jgi:hypothetical protein
MKNDQRGNRRGGFYWENEKPYVSVTNVLKVIDKPALRYWFGKEVFLAMVKDPTLDEKAALSAPYQKSDKAKDRGTTVHSIVEAYKHSEKYIESVPAEFKGYAQAFYDWTRDNHVTILEHEKTVINEMDGYAGTLDLLVQLNGSPHYYVIDVKTGKDIYPEAFLQLSAYRRALQSQNKVKKGGTWGELGETLGKMSMKIGVLLLQEDGSYKFEKSERDYFDIFLSAKKLWEWQNEGLLNKMGYYTEQLKVEEDK